MSDKNETSNGKNFTLIHLSIDTGSFKRLFTNKIFLVIMGIILTGALAITATTITLDLTGIAAGQPVSAAPVATALNTLQNAVNKAAPVGSIMPYGGNTAPAGWLLCNGAILDMGTNPEYAELYSVIGTSFGGTGSNNFNVPDLRGMFLRGADNGSGNDPDAVSRTALKSGGNTGDAVGSKQTYGTGLPNSSFGTNSDSHNHSMGNDTHNHLLNIEGNSRSYLLTTDSGSGSLMVVTDNNTDNTRLSRINSPTNGCTLSSAIASDTHSHSCGTDTHSHSVTSGGDSESRPLNVAVNYIIKY